MVEVSIVGIWDCTSSDDEDDFYMPLKPKKARNAVFPLDCQVLFCRRSGTSVPDHQSEGNKTEESKKQIPLVSYGKVIEVGIFTDTDKPERRCNLYKVIIQNSPNANTFCIVSENVLQYAASTPVWVFLDIFGMSKWQEAVVMGSVHFLSQSEEDQQSTIGSTSNIRYSLQLLSGENSIYHGISSHNVRHRSSEIPPETRSAIPFRICSLEAASESSATQVSTEAPAIQLEQDSKYVYNKTTSPFEFILVGGKHNIREAVGLLRSYRRHQGKDTSRGEGLGDLIHRECLKWQLEGRCLPSCRRWKQHKQLNLAKAKILEEILLPVISPEGPIYCLPKAKLPHEGGAANNIKRPLEKGDLGARTRKRQKKEFHPDVAVLDTGTEALSKSFYLPGYFGPDFFLCALTDSVVQDLANRYDCSIALEGELIDSETPTYKGRNLLFVRLESVNVGKMHRCFTAIEDTLFNAAPPCLRGYLLHAIGMMNNHRQKQRDIVCSRDPCSARKIRDDLRHMCLLQAGIIPKNDGRTVSLERARALRSELQKEFPNCHIEIVEQSDDFPMIPSHIMFSGREMDDVASCRQLMQAWDRRQYTANSGPGTSRCLEEIGPRYQNALNDSVRHADDRIGAKKGGLLHTNSDNIPSLHHVDRQAESLARVPRRNLTEQTQDQMVYMDDRTEMAEMQKERCSTGVPKKENYPNEASLHSCSHDAEYKEEIDERESSENINSHFERAPDNEDEIEEEEMLPLDDLPDAW